METDKQYDGLEASEENTCKDGGCNFCTRRNPIGMVWVIKSQDDLRNLVVRMCENCLNELKEATK